jgi:hypothetical protein
MNYGYCYDSAQKCTGKAQPGTRILRDTMDELVPELGDMGIYNCRNTRGGSTLSLHGEGRAWDCAVSARTNLALGNKTAQFFVDACQMLGIQRVIWNRRQWDSRAKAWRKYSGQSPHTDHIHVELCWTAARGLSATTVRRAYAVHWTTQPKGDDMPGPFFEARIGGKTRVLTPASADGSVFACGEGKKGTAQKKALIGAGAEIHKLGSDKATALSRAYPLITR